jgi:hypothetical protein
MRVAYTIILNGLRHLTHNDYYKTMIENFDLWVIVEGVAGNTGSTSWCKNLPETIHNNFISNDGTSEYLDKLQAAYNNVRVIRPRNGPWSNKDEQVNAAITEIKKTVEECFLWQVDIDEQWTLEQLNTAESELTSNGGKTGCFYCNFFVGEKLIAKGDWGEGLITPYRRLWRWCGEEFETHEPPMLRGKNGPGLLLTPRFNHFAYYYKEDVMFKELYYSGYDGLYERWTDIQTRDFTQPQHVSLLLGRNTWWGNTNTRICKYEATS